MPNDPGTTPPTSGVDGISNLAAFDAASSSAKKSRMSEGNHSLLLGLTS
jgi:hypothetical protein